MKQTGAFQFKRLKCEAISSFWITLYYRIIEKSESTKISINIHKMSGNIEINNNVKKDIK